MIVIFIRTIQAKILQLHRAFRASKHKKPKVLITGGLGFIFSHVTEYFVKKGCEVVVIDNCSVGSNPEIIDGSFKFHKKDMVDYDVVDLIISENPGHLIHAAAITDVDY